MHSHVRLGATSDHCTRHGNVCISINITFFVIFNTVISIITEYIIMFLNYCFISLSTESSTIVCPDCCFNNLSTTTSTTPGRHSSHPNRQDDQLT